MRNKMNGRFIGAYLSHNASICDLNGIEGIFYATV